MPNTNIEHVSVNPQAIDVLVFFLQLMIESITSLSFGKICQLRLLLTAHLEHPFHIHNTASQLKDSPQNNYCFSVFMSFDPR